MKYCYTLIIFSFHLGLFSQNLEAYFANADTFFKQYVVENKVCYKAIRQEPEALNHLLNAAKEIRVSVADAANYQAFWINTYNLLVVSGVVAKYPVASPLQIDGFFDAKKYSVAGASFTLNEIENNLLRANFPEEPRFHFALVCGALGCPPIINKVYDPKILIEQLQEQTRKALNNPNFIQVSENKISISPIFKWYKEDFERKGSIKEFINKYRKIALPNTGSFSYYEYNWQLNDVK